MCDTCKIKYRMSYIRHYISGHKRLMNLMIMYYLKYDSNKVLTFLLITNISNFE